MHSIRKILALIMGMFLLAGSAWSQDTVAYHIGDTQTQALAGLRSVRNHLDTDPTAKIVVVAIGNGVDFLLEGAKESNGSDYVGLVSALVSRGVRFEVCEITLRARNLKRDQFVQEADFTPSGVVRLAKLQHQGYAYIRP
jgi:intracellular sulfur oxidation DsrE/DsrF family protein